MSIVRRYTLENARAVDPAGGSTTAMSIDGAEITMDSTWAPYIQATLRGAPPAAADLTAIEPREGWRARFICKAFDENNVQLQTLELDLGIRSRNRTYSIERPAFSLEVASDEARLQDYSDGFTYDPTGISGTASQWAANMSLEAGTTLNIGSGAPDTAVAGADAIRLPGAPFWDYISTMAEAAGARVYVDENNVCRWVSPTYTPTSGTSEITGVIQVDDVVNRDDPAWGTYAVVTYSGNSPAQYVSSDSISAGDARKSINVTRAQRKPGSGNAANKIRTASGKRGRTLTITAMADLSVRPLQSRHVAYQGLSWTGIVQSVAWTLPDGQMTVVLNIVES